MKNLLLYLLLIFTCYSCCPKEYDELNSDELSWLPYEMGDTLYFKSNLGNTDKWVVTEKKSQELSYGKGHTKCVKSYYKGSFFTLLNIKDSTGYELAVLRDSETRRILMSFRNTGSVALGYDLFTNDTLMIEGSKYLKSISGIHSYVFKKKIGLHKYYLLDSVEVYEKF
jgi:hypothetical protein